MEPDASQPPELTAKDRVKVAALIDPEPLECGGVGLLEDAPRTARWSFGRRSTYAVARLHLGLGWPQGILRRACPAGIDRCVTHRVDDAEVPAPAARHAANPSPNTATNAQDRASGVGGPVDRGEGHEAEQLPLPGAVWETGQPAAEPAPPPQPSADPTVSEDEQEVAPGGTNGWHQAASGDTGPLTPERGQGQVAAGAGGANPGATRPPARRRPHSTVARWVGRNRRRVWRTVAAVAAVWAVVLTVHQCTAAVSRIDLPDVPDVTVPGPPPTTPDPLLPPTDPPSPTETVAETTSSIGPAFTPPEPCTPSHCPSLDR